MRRVALLLPLLSACGGGDVPTAPPSLPFGAIAFTPPAYYQTWWRLTETCSGHSGSMATVSWYLVPGEVFELNGQYVAGYTVALFNQIVLAGDVVSDGPSVRHEMLHQLLGASVDGHPRSQFLGACGGTVYCSSRCINDGGPAPAVTPGAVLLSPYDLDISVGVTPENPSLANESGHIAMTVLAANRSGQPAEVTLPGGIGFSFSLTNDKGYLRLVDVAATQPETTRFAVGEVKRYVFDFRIDQEEFGGIPRREALQPGTYTFAGAYGGTWAPRPPTVSVIR